MGIPATMNENLKRSETKNFMKKLEKMDHIPINLARICGNCNCIHQIDGDCPSCGDGHSELLLKFFPVAKGSH